MARRRAAPQPPRSAYWARRVRSISFKRALHALIAVELRSIAGRRIAEVVDPAAVRRTLRKLEIGALDRDALGELLIAVEHRFNTRLRREPRSLLAILGPELAPDVEALLTADIHLPPFVDDFVAGMLDQEFVRKLLTDLIFTAIGAFNRRVNPLFGAVATHMLEDQIKGFIRWFMPTLQRQAVAFATSGTNQRLVVEFSRAFLRQLLDAPVSHFAELPSPGQRRRAEALLRKALRTKQADAALRRAATQAWDDLYRSLAHRSVGEVLDVSACADAATEAVIAGLRELFARDAVAHFVAAEIERAAAQHP